MTITVEWAAAAHVGRVRKLNEDSFHAQIPVFAVADGMGGHAAGEVASALAVERLSGLAGGPWVEAEELVATIKTANADILQQADGSESKHGMGTTVTGIALSRADGRDVVIVFNVGDSRTYRWRDRSLEQISTDHSVVQELVDAGDVTSDEARVHPQRNVVTRALGVSTDLDIDTLVLDVEVGDRFLICSDGLTGELDDEELVSAMGRGAVLTNVAAALVDGAVARGGRDNVTVVVVEVRAIVDSGVDDDTNPRRRRELIREAPTVKVDVIDVAEVEASDTEGHLISRVPRSTDDGAGSR